MNEHCSKTREWKIKWSEHDTERNNNIKEENNNNGTHSAKSGAFCKRTLINSININCVIKNLFIKLNKQMELNQEHSVYKQEKINCT